jgi:hypothetical protein
MVIKESTVAFAAPLAFTMKLCKCIDFAAKTAGDSESVCICLGYLGWCNTNRTNHICVVSPMVVKESTAAFAATVAFTMKLCKCIDFAAKTAGDSDSGCTCLGYLG